MLVLQRKASERINIGDDIVVYVTKIRGKIASIAIDAPTNIAVHRGEIYDAIKKAKESGDDQSAA